MRLSRRESSEICCVGEALPGSLSICSTRLACLQTDVFSFEGVRHTENVVTSAVECDGFSALSGAMLRYRIVASRLGDSESVRAPGIVRAVSAPSESIGEDA